MRERSCAMVVVLICVGWGCGSDPPPSDETAKVSCEKYREHLLDIRVASVRSHREEHRAALAASLGDDFVADCEQRLTQADLDCAMAANDAEQLTACSEEH